MLPEFSECLSLSKVRFLVKKCFRGQVVDFVEDFDEYTYIIVSRIIL